MSQVSAVIADDEPLARERIRTLLGRESDVEVVGECADGSTAIEVIQRQQPDLVFLDVQMPEVGGFEVLEAVGAERAPAVIFVTAYDQYAVRAFEVNALDYLLKPFDRERFRKAMARGRAELEGEGGRRRLMALLEHLRSDRRVERRLVLKSGGRISFLRAAEVDWIEAAGNYLRLHAGKESHLLRETMKGIEERLDPGTFVRIHRSVIVNVDRIAVLEAAFHGEYWVVLRDGTRLASSRSYGAGLKALVRTGDAGPAKEG
jgi:two-component system, LytTR family, response regulator